MHLRRAMLLFAIVLGLAALATSVSRPRETRTPSPPPATERAPTATPGEPASRPLVLRFSAEGKPRRRGLEAGRSAAVTVAVDRPGQVELRGLGLNAPAEPATPARFEVLPERPQDVGVRFTAAGDDESRLIGTLVVSD